MLFGVTAVTLVSIMTAVASVLATIANAATSPITLVQQTRSGTMGTARPSSLTRSVSYTHNNIKRASLKNCQLSIYSWSTNYDKI